MSSKKFQENERPFGDSGETNEIDDLVGTQIVDGGNDNEAQHSFQEIANEERVEGNHDNGIVEVLFLFAIFYRVYSMALPILFLLPQLVEFRVDP